jgi:hypothetical protein
MRSDVCLACFYMRAKCVNLLLDVLGIKFYVAARVPESMYIRGPTGSRMRSASRYPPRTHIRVTYY